MASDATISTHQKDNDLILRVENLTKRFPGVLANEDVSFDVRKGEIHCLLGENGAGKSTLTECLYGYYQPDGGTIYLKGKPENISSPADAIRLGIGMVHQHFVLVEPLTVIDNVMLGNESSRIVLNISQAQQKLNSLCATYGVALNLKAKIWQLSVAQQQWVEILKALYTNVDLLILDEPTAVLTPQESKNLFSVLQQMKAEGLSIILITHKLEEVMQVSDRVTVLRKGKKIATVNTSEVTKVDLAQMMVGREVIFDVKREKVEFGKHVLEIKDLHALDDWQLEVLHGISLSLRQSEILGIASISGNGQRELSEVLVGVRPAKSGQILLDGEDITDSSVQEVMGKGVAFIPQDRINEGLVGEFSIAENLVLGFQDMKPYRRGLLINNRAIDDFAQKSIVDFDIATPSASTRTKSLSGGNLQKVILARELSQHPKCLIANNPSRGLDVGAIEYVHGRLLEERRSGAGILLFSEDLEEIFMLSDRIAVLFRGQILGLFNTEEATLERVGLLMAGLREEES